MLILALGLVRQICKAPRQWQQVCPQLVHLRNIADCEDAKPVESERLGRSLSGGRSFSAREVLHSHARSPHLLDLGPQRAARLSQRLIGNHLDGPLGRLRSALVGCGHIL
eukprot:scaffold2908_cov257-Pinguiococcus_pyrenoidosus.AAC.9